MNEQQQFWAQDYAEEYIRKNSQFDRALGVEGWKKMLASGQDIRSVLECGCNIGRNIDFLTEALPYATKSIVEISKPAFDYVTRKHHLSQAFNGPIEASAFPEKFDLVFTIGVLIHIHPDNLLTVMKKMFDYSNRTLTALVAAEAEATGEAPPRLAALQRLAALAAGGGRAE